MVEAAIALSFLVLLMSSAIMAARGGMGAFRATQDASGAEARVRRAMDRTAFELLSVGEEELFPNPTNDFGTSDLLFRKAIGLNGTQVVWGEQTQPERWVLADAQTSGGLLIAVAPEREAGLMRDLEAAGTHARARIGRVLAPESGAEPGVIRIRGRLEQAVKL